MRGASTKGTWPSRAFLSRVIAASSASTSTASIRTGSPTASRSRSWRPPGSSDARPSRPARERVAARGPVVEHGAQPALLLVALDAAGLEAAGAADDALEDRELAREQ